MYQSLSLLVTVSLSHPSTAILYPPAARPPPPHPHNTLVLATVAAPGMVGGFCPPRRDGLSVGKLARVFVLAVDSCARAEVGGQPVPQDIFDDGHGREHAFSFY